MNSIAPDKCQVMLKSRALISATMIVLMHLLAVPIMSLYGLRICPVLNVLGFLGGCIYLSSYVVTVLVLNFVLLINLLNKVQHHDSQYVRDLVVKAPRYAFLIYLLATIIALGVLYVVFQIQHISSVSRAPEVLIVLSLLIGIFQYYVFNWAIQPVLSQAIAKSLPVDDNGIDFSKRTWFESMVLGFAPIMLILLVGIHFVARQSLQLSHGHIAPGLSTDEFVKEMIIVFSLFMIWLVAVYSFYFASESDQAERIRVHLDKISKLELEYRSNGFSRGVWGAILKTLNKTSELLGEKARLVSSFSKFVATSVAQQAVIGEVKVGGVRKELTVFMSDLRDFTAISQDLHPERVVRLLNIYFNEMLEELNKHGVVVDKFIGDGILGYVENAFNDQDFKRAKYEQNQKVVAASFGMVTRLKSVNDKLKAEGLPCLKLGVGIYRGPVILGNIGSESRMQHTIIGDTVNRAARLESLCKELSTSLVIDKSVYDTLDEKSQMLFKYCGTHAVKGLTEKVEIYCLQS